MAMWSGLKLGMSTKKGTSKGAKRGEDGRERSKQGTGEAGLIVDGSGRKGDEHGQGGCHCVEKKKKKAGVYFGRRDGTGRALE